jgi:hypothetical protein
METGRQPRIDSQVAVCSASGKQVTDDSIELVLVRAIRFGAYRLEE